MAPSLTWDVPGMCQREWDVTVVRHEAENPADRSLADLDEPALVDACLGGRPGAFDVVVERHRRKVYQLCYRFVGNHEDASDLSQDVFIRAFRGLRSFRGGSSLGTWLYRIGVNVCLNRVNTRSPPIESIDERPHIDTRSESASDRLLRDERAARVRRRLRSFRASSARR